MRLPRWPLADADPGIRAIPALPAMAPMELRRFGQARSAYTTARTKVTGLLLRERLADSGLPPVWSGKRRLHLTLLVLVGFGQATAAGVGAWLFSEALTPAGAGLRGLLFVVLIAAAVTIGLLGMADRVLAERLSQDYVHEIRLRLIRRNLLDDRVNSLGVSVTRTTNDLTLLMNWITRGVAPLAAGIPLIIGVGVVLFLLDPLLAVGLVVPIVLLVPAMRMLAPIASGRAHTVRTQRGRLSAQLTEVLESTGANRMAGGPDTAMERVDTYSRSLVSVSIQRAKAVGAMRGAVAATSGIGTTVVIGTWLLAGLPSHRIAGALTLVGFLVSPLHNLGRVAEQRQTYRAGQRGMGPAVELPTDSALDRVGVAKVPSAYIGGAVAAAYLELSNGTTMPELSAQRGARVVVDAGSEGLTSEVLERFVSLREGHVGEIVVGGKNLAVAGSNEFRRLVGYAARGMVVRRGSVSRTVRYRSPDSEPGEVDRLVGEVGLADRVAGLGQGADTVLVRGGEPLTDNERALLLLAGAMLDDPPLLVFDHLDEDLGASGRRTMRRLLANYPGVVILASDDPDQIITPTHIWRPDGVHRIEAA